MRTRKQIVYVQQRWEGSTIIYTRQKVTTYHDAPTHRTDDMITVFDSARWLDQCTFLEDRSLARIAITHSAVM